MKTTSLLAIQRVLGDAGVIFLDPGEHREGALGPHTGTLSEPRLMEQ